MTSRTRSWLVIASVALVAAAVLSFATSSFAAEPAAVARTLEPSVARWAFLTAAAATSVSSIAAAYAVARVGSAAVGALAEKPELFGRVVVLVGLAEGIAIYGLIVSILILNRLT